VSFASAASAKKEALACAAAKNGEPKEVAAEAEKVTELGEVCV
jgi:hypothetical protein